MKIPSRDELAHYWAVASWFKPWQHEFWLGLAHDLVEDGYISWEWAYRWPELWCISRIPGERYSDYIWRLNEMTHGPARRVKLRDLYSNRWERTPTKPELHARYDAAVEFLTEESFK